MKQNHSQPSNLIHPAPSAPGMRMLLVAMRRMTAHGIRDAHAAQMIIGATGIHFRMALVLLRAFILEIAQVSHRSITMAPCCSLRMTTDENLLLDALLLAGQEPDRAEKVLAELTGGGPVHAPLSLAVTLGQTLRDAGIGLA